MKTKACKANSHISSSTSWAPASTSSTLPPERDEEVKEDSDTPEAFQQPGIDHKASENPRRVSVGKSL